MIPGHKWGSSAVNTQQTQASSNPRLRMMLEQEVCWPQSKSLVFTLGALNCNNVTVSCFVVGWMWVLNFIHGYAEILLIHFLSHSDVFFVPLSLSSFVPLSSCSLFPSVPAWDEESDSSSRTHSEKRRQRGHCLRLLPPTALEKGGGGTQPSALHLGGQ